MCTNNGKRIYCVMVCITRVVTDAGGCFIDARSLDFLVASFSLVNCTKIMLPDSNSWDRSVLSTAILLSAILLSCYPVILVCYI